MYLFMESRITHLVPDANLDLLGFTTVRAGRGTKACGKSRGRGLFMCINKRWCNPGHVSGDSVLSGSRTVSYYPAILFAERV